MSNDDSSAITPDPWSSLRRFTNARIGLGSTGDSLPTRALLDFQSDHAAARDAVHAALDCEWLTAQLAQQGDAVVCLHSAAEDRTTYLKRPDLGRILSAESRRTLTEYAAQNPTTYDVVFVIADGLSAQAVHDQAAALLHPTVAALREQGWRVAPLVVVAQGRVAIGDEIGAMLGAEQVAVLIGERPGLSVAASLGVYLTYAPRVGCTDAERNCISNIHAAGLVTAAAHDALLFFLNEARRRQLTGVELKDTRERTAAISGE